MGKHRTGINPSAVTLDDILANLAARPLEPQHVQPDAPEVVGLEGLLAGPRAFAVAHDAVQQIDTAPARAAVTGPATDPGLVAQPAATRTLTLVTADQTVLMDTVGSRPAPPRSRRGSSLAAAAGVVAVAAGLVLSQAPDASAEVKPQPQPRTNPGLPVQRATAAVSQHTDATYTVKSGDTLAKIGAALGIPWQSIATANGFTSPYLIRPGQVLRLPGSSTAPAPAPAPTGGTAAPTGAAAKAVWIAEAQIGKRYLYGGSGPNSFDCSGLIQYAYKAAGVSLPRTSAAQATAGRAVSPADLKPGDIIAYYSPVSHVALYIGNGQVVEAANPANGIAIHSISWAGKPVAYRRVVG